MSHTGIIILRVSSLHSASGRRNYQFLSILACVDYIFTMFTSFFKRSLVFVFLAVPVFACRMLGVIALPDHSLSSTYINGQLHPYLMEEFEEFRLQGGSGGWPYNNSDGWGMTSYHLSQDILEAQTVRSEVEAFSDNNYYYQTAALLAPSEVPVLMGHLRQTSSGADGIENPHPFIYTDDSGTTFSFGHNGDLNKDDLRELIGDEWLTINPPQTYGGGAWDGSGWENVVDSELFFFWIVMNIESSETITDGIIQALIILEEQQPINIKNFMLSDGHDLYAYRRSSASDIYYFDASNDPTIPPHLSNSNHRAIMSTPPPDGLVSELPWLELADRTLLIFRADGSTELQSGFLTTDLKQETYIPQQVSLSLAYPNPFNNSTVIPLNVDKSGVYTLRIFNSRGQLVFSKTKTVNIRGEYSFQWSGRNEQGNELTSGSYFFQIKNESGNISTGKLLMLK
ncbi:MAG: T9SS type A sorting domain-containing protein [Candidatus Marinimicrobia bacterium]|nr:T9SS type A sorting domain-containing protein [Candidatus Neomarinimicrobiota bacterium]MBT4295010.1 T9SS type A sorting domain-containing protein [Candidatus Neomarinimicrobiota bacterium]MBT4946499.1 T9SS type A sorting domain-containing protein [Candidatus Neomarinimicrobiota bacterium]MBT5313596.1 T9SS type A sorting domain-containing protein [Candidatus Neomarinimicrobiota bacterium]MBT6759027.1 T9SS type A sorting domain-containing protein [Candidatus Neomarinimicrobiota bacterium]